MSSVDAVTEVKLVVQALRLNTLSKLTFADSKRFDALIGDVFLGIEFTDMEYASLKTALEEAMTEMGLVQSTIQVHFLLIS